MDIHDENLIPSREEIAASERDNPVPREPGSGTTGASGSLPEGIVVPGRKGYVRTPYTDPPRLVDVRSFDAGTRVRCPYSGRVFIVPNGGLAPVEAQVSTDAEAPVESIEVKPSPTAKTEAPSAPKEVEVSAVASAPEDAPSAVEKPAKDAAAVAAAEEETTEVAVTKPSADEPAPKAGEEVEAEKTGTLATVRDSAGGNNNATRQQRQRENRQRQAAEAEAAKAAEAAEAAEAGAAPEDTAADEEKPEAKASDKTEETPSGEAEVAVAADGADLPPYGNRIEGRPGFAHSPFAEEHQIVNIKGIDAGTVVRCPYTGKVFRVPPAEVAAE